MAPTHTRSPRRSCIDNCDHPFGWQLDLYEAGLIYDLSAAKEERELQNKEPAIDIQIRPLGASAASLVISIINRADFNIAPQSIEVENSLEAGTLYAIDLAVFPARLKSTRQATNHPPTHSVGAHPGPRLALGRGDLDL